MALGKGRFLILVLFIIVGIIIFLPFELVMTPERQLQIVDDTGKPINRALVRHIWSQYSINIRDEKDFRTDSEGKVFLPRRSVKTCVFSILFGALNQFRELGIHASYGTYETIAVFAEDHIDRWFYDGNGLTGKVSIISLIQKPGTSLFGDHPRLKDASDFSGERGKALNNPRREGGRP